MVKKYASKRTTPIQYFSARSRYNLAVNILRRLPFELQVGIQRQAGRAVHRARQSLVNAQIRRGVRLRRARPFLRSVNVRRFYCKKKK